MAYLKGLGVPALESVVREGHTLEGALCMVYKEWDCCWVLFVIFVEKQSCF